MSDPARAARLTAIALLKMVRCPHDERTGGNDYILCHQCGLQWDYRKWPDWSAGARDMLAQLVSAHVETLQQQIAELKEDLRSVHYYIARLTEKRAQSFDEVNIPLQDWAKTLRELAEGWPVNTAKNLLERAEQAEQQRDAAHAALRKLQPFLEDHRQQHRDPNDDSYNNCEGDEECAWCSETRDIIDAALAPAQETER
jgi:hypothetical protein